MLEEIVREMLRRKVILGTAYGAGILLFVLELVTGSWSEKDVLTAIIMAAGITALLGFSRRAAPDIINHNQLGMPLLTLPDETAIGRLVMPLIFWFDMLILFSAGFLIFGRGDFHSGIIMKILSLNGLIFWTNGFIFVESIVQPGLSVTCFLYRAFSTAILLVFLSFLLCILLSAIGISIHPVNSAMAAFATPAAAILLNVSGIFLSYLFVKRFL